MECSDLCLELNSNIVYLGIYVLLVLLYFVIELLDFPNYFVNSFLPCVLTTIHVSIFVEEPMEVLMIVLFSLPLVHGSDLD